VRAGSAFPNGTNKSRCGKVLGCSSWELVNDIAPCLLNGTLVLPHEAFLSGLAVRCKIGEKRLRIKKFVPCLPETGSATHDMGEH